MQLVSYLGIILHFFNTWLHINLNGLGGNGTHAIMGMPIWDGVGDRDQDRRPQVCTSSLFTPNPINQFPCTASVHLC